MNCRQHFDRNAGILMPVSALPSEYGIGTMGVEAMKFVDFLVEARQKYWQVLPLGPTSYGDSPYQSFSAFAGNPYFIDLETLEEEGLLTKEYVESFDWGEQEDSIDYEKMFNSRFKVLEAAFEKFSRVAVGAAFEKFKNDNAAWLDDYALYMACKEHFGYKAWDEWDDDIRFRKAGAVARYSGMLSDKVEFWKFCQYEFYKQWNKLKNYANSKNIQIIGDIPIYMAYDSADVWAEPGMFLLDENLKADEVAGVPPDAFTELGQKWGNPLYDWDAHEQDGFRWWRRRMAAQASLFDVIRIDHFLGIIKYYSIPAADPDAKHGEYRKGPGDKLIRAINESIGDKRIIAEDLGVAMPEVTSILEENGYPGMKVLEFAFDGNTQNPHLPHNYSNNLVVYGGTHDNETLYGYYTEHSPEELKYAYAYLNTASPRKMVEESFRMVYASVANVAVFQMQDVLCLDNSARINFPSTLGGNWKWRMKSDELTSQHIAWLAHLTSVFGRS